MTRIAPAVVSLDGVLVVIVGFYVLISAANSFQGDGFLLLVAGIALILFGVLMVLRWNLSVVRAGLIGLTAGYFASALTEFQVATDPCDVNATLASCAGHVPGGLPWLVYQGPLLLGVLAFVLLAFGPLLKSRS